MSACLLMPTCRFTCHEGHLRDHHQNEKGGPQDHAPRHHQGSGEPGMGSRLEGEDVATRQLRTWEWISEVQ